MSWKACATCSLRLRRVRSRSRVVPGPIGRLGLQAGNCWEILQEDRRADDRFDDVAQDAGRGSIIWKKTGPISATDTKRDTAPELATAAPGTPGREPSGAGVHGSRPILRVGEDAQRR